MLRLTSRHCRHRPPYITSQTASPSGRFFSARSSLLARKPEKTGIDARSLQMRDVQFRNSTPVKLSLSAQESIQHDTIHRAWQLYLRRRRESREAELERQFHKMAVACKDLAQHDPALFRGSMIKDKKRKFPVEMRAMTDTPAAKGWDYGWTAPEVEVETGDGRP